MNGSSVLSGEKEYRDRLGKDLAKLEFRENQVEAIVEHKTPRKLGREERY